MTTQLAKTRIVLILVILGFLLTACAPAPNTVTRENYEKLKMGMTYDAVVGIMGEPFQVSTFMGVKQCTWANGERHIHAKFMASRAIYYSSKGLQKSQEQPAPSPARRPHS